MALRVKKEETKSKGDGLVCKREGETEVSGLRLYDFRDWKGNRVVHLTWREQYESLFEEMFSRIEEGWNVIDVGSAVGYYTLKAASKVGLSGKVLSIEPHPQVFQVLRMNLELYGLTNVVPVQKAVGNRAGKVRLYESTTRGGTSIYPPRPITSVDMKRISRTISYVKTGEFVGKLINRVKIFGEKLAQVEVEIDTLDNIVQDIGMNRVDLVKIDIQGSEYETLKGSTTILEYSKPILLVEVHERWDWARGKLFKLLDELGYQVDKRQEQGKLFVKGAAKCKAK